MPPLPHENPVLLGDVSTDSTDSTDSDDNDDSTDSTESDDNDDSTDSDDNDDSTDPILLGDESTCTYVCHDTTGQ